MQVIHDHQVKAVVVRQVGHMAQTGWQGEPLTDANWRTLVRQRLRRLDWQNLRTDVRPFVEPGFDLSLLTLENLERVLEK